MKNRVKINELEPQLRTIVKAIEKGAGEDMRDYIEAYNRATNNAVRLMRSDCINSNLRDSMIVETMELKFFHRSAWEGCLLIDRLNHYTISICTRQTLEGIARTQNRHIPHYLQTILYVENSDVEVEYRQMDLNDYQPGAITQFTDEDYRDDYGKIMEDEISFDDDYTHLVVVYEVERYEVTYIAVKLLDRNLDTAFEYSLIDLLQPNFGELTRNNVEGKKKEDVHNLVAVKAEIKKKNKKKKEMEPEITVRKGERENQA